jgi:hypothetical protein
MDTKSELVRRSRRIAGLPVVDYADDCISDFSDDFVNTEEFDDSDDFSNDVPYEPYASRLSAQTCAKIIEYMFFAVGSVLLLASLVIR